MIVEMFKAPRCIKELAECLKEKNENTFFVAGGTDLLIKINEKNMSNYSIIDLCSVSEMRNIEEMEEIIVIGAAVTMTEIEKSEIIKKHIKALGIAAKNLGSCQIRNRATIGGNVANGSQSADTLPVLYSYNAIAEILNKYGETKRVLISEIALAQDEVITKFIISKGNYVSSFGKIGSRTSVTISKLNCCVKAKFDGKIIEQISIYMGAVGTKPVKATIIEKILIGKELTKNISFKVKDEIRQQIELFIPNRSSKHYKKEAAIAVLDDVMEAILCQI